ncbi:MAG: hypothetical protein ATN33_00765 [Epulopiscium sp. Nele67-Bin001]|nr:MAG: hypothetical protein ATN33_00765 [Epulopiscium sp. Nele67-Bin001]
MHSIYKNNLRAAQKTQRGFWAPAVVIFAKEDKERRSGQTEVILRLKSQSEASLSQSFITHIMAGVSQRLSLPRHCLNLPKNVSDQYQEG